MLGPKKAQRRNLGVQKHLFLVYALADYFHLDPSLVTASLFKSKIKKHLWNLPVLAEDPRHVVPLQGHCLQFHWPIEYEVSPLLPELMQVFQYQASFKYLPQILGYKIEGWRLLQKSQRRPRQLRAISITTMESTEISTKLSRLFSVSLPTLVTHWIPKDDASSIPSLFAALRQFPPNPDLDFIPNTLRCVKIQWYHKIY